MFQITRRSVDDYPHGPLFHMRNAGHLPRLPARPDGSDDRRTKADPAGQPWWLPLRP